jgi:hypothetical protein
MKAFTPLLLAIGAAAQDWSSGHPPPPPPNALYPSPQGGHGPPTSNPDSSPSSWPQPPSGYGPPVEHGSDFVPDHVLVVTYEEIPVACQSRWSTVVNGTTPGPTLTLQPGKTSWIRVYNNQPEWNLTIVSASRIGLCPVD